MDEYTPGCHQQAVKSFNIQLYIGSFYCQAVASILWQYMDESTPGCHQQAVKLFNILHQVAPSSWICEDVIGRGLVADHEVWYRKVPKFSDARKLCCNLAKIQTLGYFVKKMQMNSEGPDQTAPLGAV